MVRTTALLWLLVPCGLLALGLNDSCDETDRMEEQEFVVLAMSNLQFEIEAGGQAYARATDESIVACGAQMASDYGAACTELAELAALKGLDVPDILQENEQLMLEGLVVPAGMAFDVNYTERMTRWHRDAIRLFEQAVGPNGVPDGELRQWAAVKLSMLKEDSIYQAFRVAPHGQSSDEPAEWHTLVSTR